MTEKEKIKVRYFRTEGLSYGAIANKLEIPVNTIKSFCRRNGLTGIASKEPITLCYQCNKRLERKDGRKPQKFCSEECRRAWWKAHPELITRKAYYSITCAYCGEEFRSYGNRKRKYCCHACYIAARFGVDRTGKEGVKHGEKN